MVEITFLNILGSGILGNFISHWFTPLQGIKRRLLSFLSIVPFISLVEEALNCSKCSSFWLGLLIFQDLFVAAIVSLVGYLINHIIDRIEVWYE